MTSAYADDLRKGVDVVYSGRRRLLSLGAFFILLLLAGCGREEVVVPPPFTLTPPDFNLPSTAAERSAASLIIDTDFGYDVDDVGALAVAHALADRNEARLLATVSVVGDPLSAAAIDVINTYYGRPELPLGAMQGERWNEAEGYWFKTTGDFLEPLARRYPSDVKHKIQAPEAVQVYRQVLAAEPDNSVTIVTLGFTLNLANLLESKGDAYSPLDGRALVQQKVKKLVVMGSSKGRWHPDFNLGDGPHRDARTSQMVFERWPTAVVFVGGELGTRIQTGKSLRAQLPENPVATAYDIYPGVNGHGERASWDLVAVLYAVRGEAFWKTVTDEHIVIADNGSGHWREGAVSPARNRLDQTASSREIEGVLEDLLSQEPGHTSVPETQASIHEQL